MSETAALALIGVTVLGMVLLTVASVHYTRKVLSEPEEHDEDDEDAFAGHGAAH